MGNTKKAILEAGLQKQVELISDFRTRVKDAMSNEGNVNEESYDSHQQTFEAQVLAEVNLLNDELEFANHELNEMKKIDSDYKHKHVDYGAVVKTDQRTFFISASLEEFTVGGEKYFGISINSPIYQAMRGKRAGERFSCHDIEYLIEAVY